MEILIKLKPSHKNNGQKTISIQLLLACAVHTTVIEATNRRFVAIKNASLLFHVIWLLK